MKSILIFAVCCVHLFFLCCIVFKKPPIAEKKKMHPIAVRTVKEQVRSPVIPEKKSVATAPKPKPKPVSAPTPKPAVTKPVVAPKPAPKKEMPKKKPVPQQRSSIPPSLLKELEESIAKIEDKGDKLKLSKKTSPSPVQPLHIDASNDTSYIDILTEHLHSSLDLPDFGEVKIELTLRQDGTVVTLKVLKAESKQNKQYLESQLPHLQFLPLTGSFAEKKEHTFTLTFCNEI